MSGTLIAQKTSSSAKGKRYRQRRPNRILGREFFRADVGDRGITVTKGTGLTLGFLVREISQYRF